MTLGDNETRMLLIVSAISFKINEIIFCVHLLWRNISAVAFSSFL